MSMPCGWQHETKGKNLHQMVQFCVGRADFAMTVARSREMAYNNIWMSAVPGNGNGSKTEDKMERNYDSYPYASARNVTFGKKGIVATSQNLAAQAGLEILKQGGNAVDAAIAAAICLTVTEPVSNGIGGDAFALVWMKDRLYGLNASGPAPKAADAGKVLEAGYEKIPEDGWIPVTVPGIPSAWRSLWERFGRLEFGKLFEPAIAYAREGWPVSCVVAAAWKESFARFEKYAGDPLYEEWFRVFAPSGRAPEAGEMWSSPLHAASLQELAESGCESFYRGRLAGVIADWSEKTGGWLRREDLAAYRPEWVEPVSVNYRGYDVWEIPPNGHGIVALMALNILKHFDLKHCSGQERLHLELEAMKLAFADGKRYIADPACMEVSVEELLSADYAAQRAGKIGSRAAMPECGDPSCRGTVYLCTADGEGNMVSYIQSNYCGFGSGIVVPGTGIALHNRGANFSLKENDANRLAPGRKPYHTIIPGFLTREGKAVGPFGVMGGFMQPQGHVQVLVNMLDLGMNPQAALDAPRWQWTGDMRIEMEASWPEEMREAMRERGHEISVPASSSGFGKGQIILRNEEGVLTAGTEPRSDGCAAAW